MIEAEESKNIIELVAVSFLAIEKFGCPYCGYRSFSTPMSGGGTAVCVCGECDLQFAGLADGLAKSAIGFGDFYPVLRQHPRTGTPSHGTPDTRPEGGGEFFSSRGIGMDRVPCFVCGDSKNYNNNISGFIRTKDAGERIGEYFSNEQYLDYRENCPDRIQFKIGACKNHTAELRYLDALVSDGVITEDKVKESMLITSKIEMVIRDYYYDLDMMQIDGAQKKAFNRIENILGLVWRSGTEKDARERAEKRRKVDEEEEKCISENQ
jgi:hypothetical protein